MNFMDLVLLRLLYAVDESIKNNVRYSKDNRMK